MKRIASLFSILLLGSLLTLVGLSGCTQTPSSDNTSSNTPQKDHSSNQDKNSDDTDDTIVAGSVDTSSKYSFTVDYALTGVDKYSDLPEVILVGEFTNNSDATISFSSALQGEAYQGGHELSTAYLRGTSSYNYEKIAPNKTVPAFIGWKLKDATSPITITVTDQTHYAKAKIFEQTYTIDELLKNSKEFSKNLDDFITQEKSIDL